VFHTNLAVSHMLALTKDRTRLYCSNMRDGSVSAFDFQTGKKLKGVRTGRECEGVGVTPDGRWVWAGNRAEDTISIIDTRTLEVTKRITSPGFPYRAQFTPDGKLALIPHAEASALVVADVASQSIVKSIRLGLTKVMPLLPFATTTRCWSSTSRAATRSRASACKAVPTASRIRRSSARSG
jgi:YVTN family beta-propeller protein